MEYWTDMIESETPISSTQPSLIRSLRTGFDAITNHVWLILFPVMLDIFIWLGPHLRIKNMLDTTYQEIVRIPGWSAYQTPDTLKANQEMWQFIADHFNLTILLRSFPVGIPSLMSGRTPLDSPMGSPLLIEISSLGIAFIICVALTLIGLIVGTLYYITVAQASLVGKVDFGRALTDWPRAALREIGLALAWGIIFIAVSLPAICLISLFLLGGASLGQLSLLFYAGVLVWLFFPLLFSGHGIITYQQKILASMRSSVRLTRLTLPMTGLMILVIIGLSQGLDIIWRWPTEDSWLSLIGIAGHAFVTTGLLAASFIYYRDTNRWIEEALIQTKFSSLNRGGIKKND